MVIVPPRSETLLEDVRGELGALADSTAELTRVSGRQADLTVQLLEHQRQEAKANADRERWAIVRAVVASVITTLLTLGGLYLAYLQLQKQ